MNKADRIKVEKWIKENIGMDSHEIREFRGVRLADLLQLYADEQSREEYKRGYDKGFDDADKLMEI